MLTQKNQSNTIRRRIEVVITGLTRNQVASRGLEGSNPPSPPLVNNTNSENGFVLFFAADFFGIIVERNYKSQPEQRADWANLRTI